MSEDLITALRKLRVHKRFGKRYLREDEVMDLFHTVQARLDEGEWASMRVSELTGAADECSALRQTCEALQEENRQTLQEQQEAAEAALREQQQKAAEALQAQRAQDEQALRDLQAQANEALRAQQQKANEALQDQQQKAAEAAARQEERIRALEASLEQQRREVREQDGLREERLRQLEAELERKKDELNSLSAVKAEEIASLKGELARMGRREEYLNADLTRKKREIEEYERFVTSDPVATAQERAQKILADATAERDRILQEYTSRRARVMAATRAAYYNAQQFKMTLTKRFSAMERELDETIDVLRVLENTPLDESTVLLEDPGTERRTPEGGRDE